MIFAEASKALSGCDQATHRTVVSQNAVRAPGEADKIPMHGDTANGYLLIRLLTG